MVPVLVCPTSPDELQHNNDFLPMYLHIQVFPKYFCFYDSASVCEPSDRIRVHLIPINITDLIHKECSPETTETSSKPRLHPPPTKINKGWSEDHDDTDDQLRLGCIPQESNQIYDVHKTSASTHFQGSSKVSSWMWVYSTEIGSSHHLQADVPSRQRVSFWDVSKWTESGGKATEELLDETSWKIKQVQLPEFNLKMTWMKRTFTDNLKLNWRKKKRFDPFKVQKILDQLHAKESSPSATTVGG